MGFRFRKSFKIAPGVRVNVGKKSIGISAGVKGARVSVNSSGRTTKTVSLPGTGLSYTKTGKIGGGASSTDKHDQTAPEYTPTADLPPIEPQPPRPPRTSKGTLTVLKILAILLIAMGLTLTLATVIGGALATGLGCFILYYRRTRIAWNGDKPPRCRWMVVVAVLFVLLAVGGKASPDPAADTGATAEQAAQAEQQAAAEKAAAERKAAEEKAAAEKAAAEQKAAEDKAAAEKAAAEKAAAAPQQETVYITPNGKRWHRSASCAGDNATAVTMDQVGSRTPCKKCA